MISRVNKFISILLLGTGATILHAQTSINSAGGDLTGSGGSMNYSIGQVAYTTNSGLNGSVAQGVQQPFEISVLTETEEAQDILLETAVYPNPAADYAILKMDGNSIENIRFRLYNLNGSILQNKKIESNETVIELNKYRSGTYFLKITRGNILIKTFKIIKNF